MFFLGNDAPRFLGRDIFIVVRRAGSGGCVMHSRRPVKSKSVAKFVQRVRPLRQ